LTYLEAWHCLTSASEQRRRIKRVREALLVLQVVQHASILESRDLLNRRWWIFQSLAVFACHGCAWYGAGPSRSGTSNAMAQAHPDYLEQVTAFE
jgi:hypothetical protein